MPGCATISSTSTTRPTNWLTAGFPSTRTRAWRGTIGRIPRRSLGYTGQGLAAAIQVHAHKDEISMIVKRIDEDGVLRLDPLGGAHAWKYGEGPVEILGDRQTVPGILGVGSAHTTAESHTVFQAKQQA